MSSTFETKSSSLRSSFNGIRRLAASGMVTREGLRCGGGRRQGGTNEREGYGDEGGEVRVCNPRLPGCGVIYNQHVLDSIHMMVTSVLNVFVSIGPGSETAGRKIDFSEKLGPAGCQK